MNMLGWNWVCLSDLMCVDAPRCQAGMFATVVLILGTSFCFGVHCVCFFILSKDTKLVLSVFLHVRVMTLAVMFF